MTDHECHLNPELKPLLEKSAFLDESFAGSYTFDCETGKLSCGSTYERKQQEMGISDTMSYNTPQLNTWQAKRGDAAGLQKVVVALSDASADVREVSRISAGLTVGCASEICAAQARASTQADLIHEGGVCKRPLLRELSKMGQTLQRALPADIPQAAPIITSAMSEDLRLFLLESLPADVKSLEELGFEHCVDNPQRPGHKYMEGYFHALPGSHGQYVDSIHPRLGCSIARRPAPLPLFAFCEALRHGNALLFARLEKELSRHLNAAPLANVFSRQAHLADLSVQIHWGDDVPAQDVAWHIDAANSFLHTALSLQGRRALHARRRLSKGRLSQNCLVGADDEREVIWQEEGAVYLSTPCCFPHAVEYPAVDWQCRIVAVQCRLLLTEDELWNMTGKQHTAVDIDPHGGTAAIVFRQLEAQMAAGLSMPTFDEVFNVLAKLQ